MTQKTKPSKPFLWLLAGVIVVAGGLGYFSTRTGIEKCKTACLEQQYADYHYVSINPKYGRFTEKCYCLSEQDRNSTQPETTGTRIF